MKKVFICSFVFATQLVFAQKKEYTIKVYNQTSYEKINRTHKTVIQQDTVINRAVSKTFILFHPTVALNWKSKRKNLHEIELTNFDFAQKDVHDNYGIGPVQYKSTNILIALRYESIYDFMKNKKTRIKPQLGVAISPFFDYHNQVPYFSNLYPNKQVNFGFKHYAVSRCIIALTSKWSVDVNIPFQVAQLQWIVRNNLNPSLSHTEQSYSILDFDMLGRAYSCRIGMCYKL